MTAIFVSYRREDAAGWVGRLVDVMKQGFPTVPVFFDISAIKGGEDFGQAIGRSLASCRVLLALIGPRWLTAKGEHGERRLDEAEDFVRVEVKTALERGVYVIPVLLGGARMPRAAELPADLSSLARHQAHEITDSRWGYDCEQLLGVIEEALGVPAQRSKRGAGGAISVGREAELTRVKMGDMVGVKIVGGGGSATDTGPIDVAHKAKIAETEVGDIAGIKQVSDKPGDPNAQ